MKSNKPKKQARLKASADCTAPKGASRGRRTAEAVSTVRRDPAPTGANSGRSHQPGGDSHPPPGPNTQPPDVTDGAEPIVLTRVVRLEIDDFEPRASRGSLASLSATLQAAANAMVWRWLDWHTAAGTQHRLLSLVAWYRAGKPAGGKPAAIGPACPPAMQLEWYRLLRDRFGTIQQRPRDLLLNWLAGTMRSQESPKSRWKRWQAVLLMQEKPWAFLSPQPIRLDSSNAKLVREGARLVLRMRAERDLATGKSELISLGLRQPPNSDSRGAVEYRGQWGLAAEVADGQRRLVGSQLVPDGGKWFLMMTVTSAAEPAVVDAERTAVLRPGKHDPWRLRIDGRGGYQTGGFGRIKLRGEQRSLLEAVGELREQIILRRSLQSGMADELPPRRAARLRSRKGGLLRGAWNRACTNLNRETANRLAKVLLDEGIGRLVIIAGSGRSLLETAGKQDDLPDPTSFPFHQLTLFLREKLEPCGVELVVRASLRSAKRRQEERREEFAR